MSTQDTSTKTWQTPALALVAIIVLVIAGLATLDRFLADAQNVEVHRSADRSFLEGVRLRKQGKTNGAVEAFRKAHALDRRNTQYELELIDALITANKLDQAERLIRDVLERAPNNGRANLLSAHLMIKKGNVSEAESYYHRAIYGDWPQDAAAHRVSVRMELVDYLAKRPEHGELLAELLPLQEEAGTNPAIERHLAHLFLVAGSTSRAIAAYRAIIKQNPTDAAAYAGIGEAELQNGQYNNAHQAFLKAANYKPGDPAIQQQLQLSTTLASLDPTSRRLTSMEKFRRSLRVLDMARTNLETCLADHPALASDDTRQMLASANDVVSNKLRKSIVNETAENALDVSEKAWQTRIKICGSSTSPDEAPLRILMEKVAQ